MAFQTSVGVYLGVGAEAQPAGTAPIIAASGGPDAYRAGTNGVRIGRFVFRSKVPAGDDETIIVTNVAPSATSIPLGFIQNVLQGSVGYYDSNSMMIPAGRGVSPKVGGDFWAYSTTVATAGQKVFASVTDGSIATAAAGATVADHVETNYTVAHGAPVGDLIIISSWSKA